MTPTKNPYKVVCTPLYRSPIHLVSTMITIRACERYSTDFILDIEDPNRSSIQLLLTDDAYDLLKSTHMHDMVILTVVEYQSDAMTLSHSVLGITSLEDTIHSISITGKQLNPASCPSYEKFRDYVLERFARQKSEVCSYEEA